MSSRSLAWKIPDRIGRLEELTENLWWSWHAEARELFRNIDYILWRYRGYNPVRQLLEISPERLQQLAADTRFLALYDSVMAAFDSEMSAQNTWFQTNYPNLLKGPVAYFSMEFAIHSSLPIYAGGLGILAGDTCKEASDLGLPFVGIGFMYPQGYFHQHISATGAQEEFYQQLDFDEAPIKPVLDAGGKRVIVRTPLGNASISVAVWRVAVGRGSVYLLDTNVPENAEHERQLSARLYVADPETRLRQEIVLGMGGVRVLRALGIQPGVWHANEGHTAFMTLERTREMMEGGVSFEDAVQRVRVATVFTTHTPVPAGQDVFPGELVGRYLGRYCSSLNLDHDRCLKLGRAEESNNHTFSMAVLALKMSGQCYGVSRIHGVVSRKMWQTLWPEMEEHSIPITHVTNGIHVPGWVGYEMRKVYEKYLGPDWLDRHDDTSLWDKVMSIPDSELWEARCSLRHRLVGIVIELAQAAWAAGNVEAHQLVAIGSLLHPEVLTIGFVRRFAEYKRPTLIFRDLERLKQIVRSPSRPVQIVFAGKSHPADGPSKELVRRVFNLAADREFMGRIAFLEDYGMETAWYMAQGVDVWLNAPRRLNEACGTSGMKAAVNGVLNFSVRDGWWDEGYNGANGWAVGDVLKPASSEEEDRADAESIYRTLEREIVPLFYMRDREGIPHAWLRLVKESIRTLSPRFCTRRMLKEYVACSLVPACQAQSHSE